MSARRWEMPSWNVSFCATAEVVFEITVVEREEDGVGGIAPLLFPLPEARDVGWTFVAADAGKVTLLIGKALATGAPRKAIKATIKTKDMRHSLAEIADSFKHTTPNRPPDKVAMNEFRQKYGREKVRGSCFPPTS